MVNQMYVEKLTPQHETKRYPIIFIAGLGQTGTNWLETPDGRPGWASFFLSQGYTVYLSDQPQRGRSPWHPSQGSMGTTNAKLVEQLFTAPEVYNQWPQARLHTQWPGTGRVGDPVFDAFYATQVQFQSDVALAEEMNRHAYTNLIESIGEAYLLVHSQGGAFGWLVGDRRPDLVKAIVSLEPVGAPFVDYPWAQGTRKEFGITKIEIQYEPPAGPNGTYLQTVTRAPKDEEHDECLLQTEPAKQLKNLSKIPILLVTGEASYHRPYDYCTVDYLRQAGVTVEHAQLGKEGIKGNGHMMFMEKNNIAIARRILSWLESPSKG
jgi:pimeloyl-ACP methyl ester carboxylesterase